MTALHESRRRDLDPQALGGLVVLNFGSDRRVGSDRVRRLPGPIAPFPLGGLQLLRQLLELVLRVTRSKAARAVLTKISLVDLFSERARWRGGKWYLHNFIFLFFFYPFFACPSGRRARLGQSVKKTASGCF